ncbi:exonuclease [archaeon]|nr:exonuclease [archaeon]
MSIFIVDIESDGPAPGLYSMVSFAAIKVNYEMKTTFKALVAPISKNFKPDALAISSITRLEHENYPSPEIAIVNFLNWIKKENNGERAIFMSDNLAFDWQFINYYLHAYCDENPFGHSGRRIGDFYAGLQRDFRASSKWKKLIVTKHSHDPLDDVKGNAEAFLEICKQNKIKFPS